MSPIVDPSGEAAEAWVTLAIARSTPEQLDGLDVLVTRPEPDRRLVAATCHGTRLYRLLRARYQGGILQCTEQARSIYQPVRLGLLDHLGHADVWAEHGLAWRLLPEPFADITALDALLRQQAQDGSRAWLDDFRALRERMLEKCQTRGVEPFLEVLNGYFRDIDQATEAIHRETCEANVKAGLMAECVPLPTVGLTMERYLEQEQRKLDAEKGWNAHWRSLPANLRALLLSLDPARMAQLGTLEHKQVRIICALARLVRLRWLIFAKFGYGPQQVPHSRETVTYQDLRRELLSDLEAVGLAEQRTWAADGIPERLSDLGTGLRAWDSAGIERLEEDLIRSSATKRVDELVAALDSFFVQQGIDGTISEIEQATWQANAQETPSNAPEQEAHRTADGQPTDSAEPTPNGLSIAASGSVDQAIEMTEPATRGRRTQMSKTQVEAALDEYVRECNANPTKRAVRTEFLERIGIPPGTWTDWTVYVWKTNWTSMLDESRNRVGRSG